MRKNIVNIAILCVFMLSILSVAVFADGPFDSIKKLAEPLNDLFTDEAATNVKNGTGGAYTFFKFMLTILLFAIIYYPCHKWVFADHKKIAGTVAFIFGLGGAILMPPAWVYAVFFGMWSGLVLIILFLLALAVFFFIQKIEYPLFKSLGRFGLGVIIILIGSHLAPFVEIVSTALFSQATGGTPSPNADFVGAMVFVKYIINIVGWFYIGFGFVSLFYSFGAGAIAATPGGQGFLSRIGRGWKSGFEKRGEDIGKALEETIGGTEDARNFEHHLKELKKQLRVLHFQLLRMREAITVYLRKQNVINGNEFINKANTLESARLQTNYVLASFLSEVKRVGGLSSEWASRNLILRTLSDETHDLHKLVKNNQILYKAINKILVSKNMFLNAEPLQNKIGTSNKTLEGLCFETDAVFVKMIRILKSLGLK